MKKKKTIIVEACKGCPFIILDKELNMSVCSVDTTDGLMFNDKIDKRPKWCKLNKYNLTVVSK